MAWYKRLGFTPEYFPPGFAILRRDDIQIFLQQQPHYVKPEDPGRVKREAWDIYILTDNLDLLHKEFTSQGLELSRPPCPRDYGMIEFDLMDLNGYRLVFAQPVPPASPAAKETPKSPQPLHRKQRRNPASKSAIRDSQ